MGNSGHDESLVSTMATRLRKVEEELATRNQQLQDKDKQLHEMRVKAGLDKNKDRLVVHLRAECRKAYAQVQEMEEFLADYGMVWVGSSGSPEQEPYEEILPTEEEKEEASVLAPGTWSQGTSVLETVEVDYNRIIHNIHELNIMAGDGVGLIEKGDDGIARVVQPKPVPLTLYKNGILMFGGPFRSLSDPTTRQFVQDLQDGYFPSELQARFPKGMPVKVTDLREKEYADARARVSFPGKGTALSEGAKELAAIRGYTSEDKGTATPESGVPSYNQDATVDRFLNKLPANVIRDGKIIDIRESVSAMIGTSPTSSTTVEVAETEVVKRIQSGKAGNTGPVATLRVKLDGGNKTLIVKLKYSDTIADLRRFIGEHKKGRFEIRTTFPNKTYSSGHETLEEAGLVPSANLHIKDI